MQLERIAIIGAGNMAAALIGGLCASGFNPSRIVVADRVPAQLGRLRERFGIDVAPDNVHAVCGAQLAIFAVKPQDLHSVAEQLASIVATHQPLVLSIAAGIRIDSLRIALGGFERIVRAMPNRPALLGKGITALFAPPAVSEAQRHAVEDVLRFMGAVVWLEHENQMDAVTAVSGSGPAYFFLLAELLEKAAIDTGLPPHIAHVLAMETAYGAGCMVHEPGSDAAQLRAEVTSPGGTTAAALAVLENADLRDIVRRAVAAAAGRAAELAN